MSSIKKRLANLLIRLAQRLDPRFAEFMEQSYERNVGPRN